MHYTLITMGSVSKELLRECLLAYSITGSPALGWTDGRLKAFDKREGWHGMRGLIQFVADYDNKDHPR